MQWDMNENDDFNLFCMVLKYYYHYGRLNDKWDVIFYKWPMITFTFIHGSWFVKGWYIHDLPLKLGVKEWSESIEWVLDRNSILSYFSYFIYITSSTHFTTFTEIIITFGLHFIKGPRPKIQSKKHVQRLIASLVIYLHLNQLSFHHLFVFFACLFIFESQPSSKVV